MKKKTSKSISRILAGILAIAIFTSTNGSFLVWGMSEGKLGFSGEPKIANAITVGEILKESNSSNNKNQRSVFSNTKTDLIAREVLSDKTIDALNEDANKGNKYINNNQGTSPGVFKTLWANFVGIFNKNLRTDILENLGDTTTLKNVYKERKEFSQRVHEILVNTNNTNKDKGSLIDMQLEKQEEGIAAISVLFFNYPETRYNNIIRDALIKTTNESLRDDKHTTEKQIKDLAYIFPLTALQLYPGTLDNQEWSEEILQIAISQIPKRTASFWIDNQDLSDDFSNQDRDIIISSLMKRAGGDPQMDRVIVNSALYRQAGWFKQTGKSAEVHFNSMANDPALKNLSYVYKLLEDNHKQYIPNTLKSKSLLEKVRVLDKFEISMERALAERAIWTVRNLNLSNKAVTKENVKQELENFKQVRGETSSIPIFKDRAVIILADSERWYSGNGMAYFKGERFMDSDVLSAIQKQTSKPVLFERSGDDELINRNTANDVLNRFNSTIDEPVTFVFDGHGGDNLNLYYSDKTPIHVGEVFDAYRNRWEGRKRPIKPEERDIFLLGSCFSSSFTRRILELCEKNNIPKPIIIGETEYGQYSVNELSSEGKNAFWEILHIEDNKKKTTIQDIIDVNFKNPNTNPVLYVPDKNENTRQVTDTKQYGISNRDSQMLLAGMGGGQFVNPETGEPIEIADTGSIAMDAGAGGMYVLNGNLYSETGRLQGVTRSKYFQIKNENTASNLSNSVLQARNLKVAEKGWLAKVGSAINPANWFDTKNNHTPITAEEYAKQIDNFTMYPEFKGSNWIEEEEEEAGEGEETKQQFRPIENDIEIRRVAEEVQFTSDDIDKLYNNESYGTLYDDDDMYSAQNLNDKLAAGLKIQYMLDAGRIKLSDVFSWQKVVNVVNSRNDDLIGLNEFGKSVGIDNLEKNIAKRVLELEYGGWVADVNRGARIDYDITREGAAVMLSGSLDQEGFEDIPRAAKSVMGDTGNAIKKLFTDPLEFFKEDAPKMLYHFFEGDSPTDKLEGRMQYLRDRQIHGFPEGFTGPMVDNFELNEDGQPLIAGMGGYGEDGLYYPTGAGGSPFVSGYENKKAQWEGKESAVLADSNLQVRNLNIAEKSWTEKVWSSTLGGLFSSEEADYTDEYTGMDDDGSNPMGDTFGVNKSSYGEDTYDGDYGSDVILSGPVGAVNDSLLFDVEGFNVGGVYKPPVDVTTQGANAPPEFDITDLMKNGLMSGAVAGSAEINKVLLSGGDIDLEQATRLLAGNIIEDSTLNIAKQAFGTKDENGELQLGWMGTGLANMASGAIIALADGDTDAMIKSASGAAMNASWELLKDSNILGTDVEESLGGAIGDSIKNAAKTVFETGDWEQGARVLATGVTTEYAKDIIIANQDLWGGDQMPLGQTSSITAGLVAGATSALSSVVMGGDIDVKALAVDVGGAVLQNVAVNLIEDLVVDSLVGAATDAVAEVAAQKAAEEIVGNIVPFVGIAVTIIKDLIMTGTVDVKNVAIAAVSTGAGIAAGAAMGSVIPGIGTIVGAIVGVVLSLLTSDSPSEAEIADWKASAKEAIQPSMIVDGIAGSITSQIAAVARTGDSVKAKQMMRDAIMDSALGKIANISGLSGVFAATMAVLNNRIERISGDYANEVTGVRSIEDHINTGDYMLDKLTNEYIDLKNHLKQCYAAKDDDCVSEYSQEIRKARNGLIEVATAKFNTEIVELTLQLDKLKTELSEANSEKEREEIKIRMRNLESRRSNLRTARDQSVNVLHGCTPGTEWHFVDNYCVPIAETKHHCEKGGGTWHGSLVTGSTGCTCDAAADGEWWGDHCRYGQTKEQIDARRLHNAEHACGHKLGLWKWTGSECVEKSETEHKAELCERDGGAWNGTVCVMPESYR